MPLLQPILLIVTLFSVIFTFADFQLAYVLTHGGPQNATHLFATYAFDLAMGAGHSAWVPGGAPACFVALRS